ncbi:MAG: hypothetical protein Ta2D_12620 [Rickettsiales bacterium]|nr:MAG: hypothetical protein Ta2D_12620 [Rickettsiales bacterium]
MSAELLKILNKKYVGNITKNLCIDCHNKNNNLCNERLILDAIDFFELTNPIKKYGDTLIEKLPDNIKNDKNIDKKGLGSPDLIKIENNYIIFIENTKNGHEKLVKWYNHTTKQVMKIKEIEYKILGTNLFLKNIYNDFDIKNYERIVIIFIPIDFENKNIVKIKNVFSQLGNILTIDNIKYKKERVRCKNYKEIEKTINNLKDIK